MQFLSCFFIWYSYYLKLLHFKYQSLTSPCVNKISYSSRFLSLTKLLLILLQLQPWQTIYYSPHPQIHHVLDFPLALEHYTPIATPNILPQWHLANARTFSKTQFKWHFFWRLFLNPFLFLRVESMLLHVSFHSTLQNSKTPSIILHI